jgi:hypothetical protein
MEDDVSIKAINRAGKILDYLTDQADRLDEICMLCRSRPVRVSQTCYAYDTLWENEPKTLYFCSDDCKDTFMYEESWAYFMCHECDREISEQNPQNGWHIQYRTADQEQACLSCYQERLLEEGLVFEREKLERGEIPGMFFSFGNLEPKAKGYMEVPGFTEYHVRSGETADRFIRRALELLDEGKLVVAGYEKMAIGGSEGVVTLMVKDHA